jgi:transcriptional regulator with PAS, ATPase and Fis domain
MTSLYSAPLNIRLKYYYKDVQLMEENQKRDSILNKQLLEDERLNISPFEQLQKQKELMNMSTQTETILPDIFKTTKPNITEIMSLPKPTFSETQPNIRDLQLPKSSKTLVKQQPTRNIISTELINSVLSKFKPIEENKFEDELKKRSEEFKKNSNNQLNNVMIDELKKKLIEVNKGLKDMRVSNTGQVYNKNIKPIVDELVNRVIQINELEKMAENDKNIENIVNKVLKQSIKKTNDLASNLSTYASSESGMKLDDELLRLYDVKTKGSNFYKNLLDRINKLPANQQNTSKKILKQVYQNKYGSSKGWDKNNPKSINEATNIIDSYISLGGTGFAKFIKKNKYKKYY